MNITVSIRAPAGGAAPWHQHRYSRTEVSIRAPAGGAASGSMQVFKRVGVSIRAPAGGAAKAGDKPQIKYAMFQSALPQGERLSKFLFFSIKCCFNPRSRRGSGFNDHFFRDLICVSIRAPAGGAARVRVIRRSCRRSFNPRSRRGSGLGFCVGSAALSRFNPRSRRGSG